jgi:acyl-CoA reductase-like NAD-dependent aldehyde dehydrogenase
MTFAQLAELIGDTLAKAPEADKQKLADAIETYADKYPAAWRGLQRNAMGTVLDWIVEAVEARPGMQAMLRDLDSEEQG